MRALVRLLVVTVVGAAVLAAGLTAFVASAGSLKRAGHADDEPLAFGLGELSERSVVYDRHGGVLAVLHAEENRSPTSLDQVPEHVLHAILDVEDEDFYDHGAVNLRAILRAAIANVESGDIRQGGSTITQQLVKSSLLTPKRDLSRKLKEAVLAARLESQMTKEEILGQYLNTVYFGSGAYGLQAAAETYYGVEASELTVEQGAFLAGMIRNPVGYDPISNPTGARARRDFVLGRMVSAGHLDPAEAERLKQVDVPRKRIEAIPTKEEYFVEEVKQRLLRDPRLGETAQERYNAVFRGGLRIDTTFDPELQRLADETVKRILPDTKGRFTAALVSVEPSTGAVRAMVAGPGHEQSKFNLVTQARRQPGSSFKTFVLLAALEAGYGPNDTVDGRTGCSFKVKGYREVYEPGNYEGSKGSVGSIAAATAKSLNCAYARLGLALDDDPQKSLDKVAKLAGRLGIEGDIDAVPAMSLGSEEVTPLEMASAYGVLANDGVRQEAYFVERVLDRTGKEVLTGRGKGEEVLSRQNARVATQVLQGVVDGGTGTRAKLAGRDVAGKTGTSQEWRDAWFVGYTPQLATAVWMGSPVEQVSMRSVGGIRVTGGSYPARIWGAYMGEALKGQPVVRFAAPDPRQIPKAKAVKGPGKTSTTKTTTKTTTRPRPRATTTTTARTGGDEPAVVELPPSPPPGERDPAPPATTQPAPSG